MNLVNILQNLHQFGEYFFIKMVRRSDTHKNHLIQFFPLKSPCAVNMCCHVNCTLFLIIFLILFLIFN